MNNVVLPTVNNVVLPTVNNAVLPTVNNVVLPTVNNVVLHPVNNVVLHPVNNVVLPTVNNVVLHPVNRVLSTKLFSHDNNVVAALFNDQYCYNLLTRLSNNDNNNKQAWSINIVFCSNNCEQPLLLHQC